MDACAKLIFAAAIKRSALVHEFVTRHDHCDPQPQFSHDVFTTSVVCSCGASIEATVVVDLAVTAKAK